VHADAETVSEEAAAVATVVDAEGTLMPGAAAAVLRIAVAVEDAAVLTVTLHLVCPAST